MLLRSGRLPFIDVKHGRPMDVKRAQDRTTGIIRTWRDLTSELKIARTKTLQCCEAKPGKGDSATLVVVDRALFDMYQDIINERAGQIEKIEEAIRELDALSPGWFSPFSYVTMP